MKQTQMQVLLMACRAFDDRIAVDEAKVMAWLSVFPDEMDLGFARDVLQHHYASEVSVVMPAHFIQAWKSRRSGLTALEASEAHLAEREAVERSLSDENRLRLREIMVGRRVGNG